MRKILRYRCAACFTGMLVFAGLLFSSPSLQAQCGYPSFKGTLVPNINVGGFYNGLIEWLPESYSSSPSSRYPVIIYFHGAGAANDGTADSLCKILSDVQFSLPRHIEDGVFPETVPRSNDTPYIVIAPQWPSLDTNANYGSQTDALIDYLISNYRIDSARIYLTGMSIGGNFVLDYVSGNIDHARRIAAVTLASSCFPVPLTHGVNGPSIIANAELPVWFTNCDQDNDYYCGVDAATRWVDSINSFSPVVPPRFSVFGPNNVGASYPASLNYCQGFAHDTWTAMYSPDFAPLDGGLNFYNWIYQFEADVMLPVSLKNFTVRLYNGKVYLRWVTATEKNNAFFTIERAGSNMTFKSLTTIPGSGNSGNEVVYEYIDDQPLSQLSFYRLVQTDIDGKKQYFETRKVMNRGTGKGLVLAAPNPFNTELSAFITVDKKQKVAVWLTDMSGRKLAQVSRLYDEGTTEINLPVNQLPKGIYFLKAAGETITETHKIIKQ